MSDWIDESFEEMTYLDHLAASRMAVFDLESNRA